MHKLNRLCVFCGSNDGAKKEYAEAAHQLAEVMYANRIGLVYGGATIGLMGKIADSLLKLGGEVIGVIPSFLLEKEIAHEDVTELHIVNSMHERKTLMADMSDGFVMMPGGGGTFEEFFEIFTWNQLGLIKKPYGILNVENYFDLLVSFLDHAVSEKFVPPLARSLMIVQETPQQLIASFMGYEKPSDAALQERPVIQSV